MLTVLQNRYFSSTWYFLAIAIGLSSIWIAPHLPLVDYPQHVGQLALLKDLLLGQAAWSEIVTINYFTPNLVTYFLGLILSTVFSVTTAFKLLISAGYVVFIFACIQLRKHFQIDPRLDWAFLLPFFGYAYKWGFITFIISAPIALFFILFADLYAKNPSLKLGGILVSIGLLLSEAHGVMFLFSLSVACCLILAHTKNVKYFILTLTPCLILILLFTVLFKLNSDFNAQLKLDNYTLNNGLALEWRLEFKRIPYALAHTVTKSIANLPAITFISTASVIFLTPWLLGLRPNFKNKTALIFFVLVDIVILFSPYHVLGTNLIHQRFAILLIPSYILLFSTKSPNALIPQKYKEKIEKGTLIVLIIGTLTSLSLHNYSNFLFKKETQDISALLGTLEINQKAFYVIANNYSQSNQHDVYDHYPVWYQVEKSGFVEGNTVLGNFASLAPFPVRYKPGFLPKDTETQFENVDLSMYRYLIVREQVNVPLTGLFKEHACKPQRLGTKGLWSTYDIKNCSG